MKILSLHQETRLFDEHVLIMQNELILTYFDVTLLLQKHLEFLKISDLAFANYAGGHVSL